MKTRTALRPGIIAVLTFLMHLNIQAQVKISGTVWGADKPLPDALIRISDSNRITNVLTNAQGQFSLSAYTPSADSLGFLVVSQGFKTYQQTFSAGSVLTGLEFRLFKDSVYQLEEVTVATKNLSVEANKKIYRINSRNYVPNAKSTEILPNLPDLSLVNGTLKVENRKNAIIFIDGLEVSLQDLNRLDVADVDKVEVITNPTSVFTTGEAIAVVNILTKKKPETFLKGELEAYAGIRLGARGFTPSLSFKSRKIMFTGFFGYGTNNQDISTLLNRSSTNDPSNNFTQESLKGVRGWQKYLSSRMKITLHPKSSLYLGGNLFAYRLAGELKGFLTTNNTKEEFRVSDLELLNKWAVSSIYNYSLNPNTDFYLKARYFHYRNSNSNLFSKTGSPEQTTDVISNTDEYAAEFSFAKRNKKWLGFPFEYSSGYKLIHRKFELQSSAFELRQYVHAWSATAGGQLSKPLSYLASVSTELTNNSGPSVNQQYVNFLPTLSLLYKWNANTSLSFDYSRKITRPGSNYLNPEPIFFSPSLILRGNLQLLPQVRNNYGLSLQKQINENTSYSFKIFYENIANSIVESFVKEGALIYTMYENAGKAAISGAYLSYTAQPFKNMSANLSFGANYNRFRSDANAVIRENSGMSYNSSLYLRTLIKKLVSLSVNGSVATPVFSLINETRYFPQFGFNAEAAVFKKALNVRLTYSDLFAWNAKARVLSGSGGFTQSAEITNNLSNLTLTLIYRLGKQFNDRYRAPSLRNDDIINK